MVIFFLLFSFLLISISPSSIIFPFKTMPIKGFPSENDIEYNISHFGNDHYSMPSYISINIGSPPQTIKFMVTHDDCNFIIGKARKCIDNQDYLSHYNRNLSSDFKFTDKYTEKNNVFINGKSCSDSMELITDITDLNKKNKYKDIGFYLGTDTNEEICGIVGLELNQYKTFGYDMNNFFQSFKDSEIIQKPDWIIKYTSKYEGLFIISPDFSQIIKNYDENKLFKINSERGSSLNSWFVVVDKIYSGENNQTINKKTFKAQINNDLDLIEGGWDYYYHITLTYFEYYIKKSICKLEEIQIDMKYYFAIECDKKKLDIEELKKFPELKFVLVCFNSEFKFDYKDLFTETKHKYFFNIIFNKFIDRWIFGKTILRKHPLLMDYEAKTISYYNENWEIDNKNTNLDKENNENYYIYFYILIGICFVIIVAIIFYLVGKKMNKMKKRRANELIDDNFDYIPNKDNNDISNNKSFENNSSLIDD